MKKLKAAGFEYSKGKQQVLVDRGSAVRKNVVLERADYTIEVPIDYFCISPTGTTGCFQYVT